MPSLPENEERRERKEKKEGEKEERRRSGTLKKWGDNKRGTACLRFLVKGWGTRIRT
jgi:hypothetical protein